MTESAFFHTPDMQIYVCLCKSYFKLYVALFIQVEMVTSEHTGRLKRY